MSLLRSVNEMLVSWVDLNAIQAASRFRRCSCGAAELQRCFSLIAVLPADVASFGLVDCESKLNPMFHKMPTAEVKGLGTCFAQNEADDKPR